MNDLISRQAAINALGEEPEVWSGKDEYAQGLNNQWHYDVNALKAVPSAQSGRYKWNPIKDGLPDEEGVYFVTDDAGGMATVYIDVFSHYEDGSPYWLYSQNVTAWMHTPEPYHGGDEE